MSVISDANWDPGSTLFAFTTDSGGKIVGWTTVVTKYIQAPHGGWQIGDISGRSFTTAQPETVNAYVRACATIDCTSTLMDEVDVGAGSSGSWSLVPEPSTAVLVGLGLAALAAHRRRP